MMMMMRVRVCVCVLACACDLLVNRVYDPRTFSDVLRVHPTSKAQARQRCGRAGREAR